MKYCGNIGFAETTETKPGVWTDNIVEKKFYGDVIKNTRKLQSSDKINDNIQMSVELSILASSYIMANVYKIVYAEYMGTKWKVTDVTPEYPRLRLTLGGVYNGQD